MTVEETAEVLSVSRETVARDWRLAKLWLLRELQEPARRPAAVQEDRPTT
jgi:DeoR/GlpR family transcriptional regulator of sugar metabolism